MYPDSGDFLKQNPAEQKIKSAFKNYPSVTRNDIARSLETQNRLWQELKKNPDDFIKQVAVGKGNVYNNSLPKFDPPKRSLTPEEKNAYNEFLSMIVPYQDSNTYGTPSNGLPNTRFYLSLTDSVTAGQLMKILTQKLISMHQSRAIPFFKYKFDSGEANGQLRFDPAYRDKGASPILYVADQSVHLTNQILEDLSKQYPAAFLPQAAPFKFSPHLRENDIWHIAMQADRDLGVTCTPEQGMKKGVSDFLTKLGLTKQWAPVESLDDVQLRNSWEQSMASVHRQPKTPWLTTDRPAPDYLQQQLSFV